MVLSFLEQVRYSQNIEMREEICKFMPFWEIVLDKDKEVLGRYNQKYFFRAKNWRVSKKNVRTRD